MNVTKLHPHSGQLVSAAIATQLTHTTNQQSFSSSALINMLFTKISFSRKDMLKVKYFITQPDTMNVITCYNPERQCPVWQPRPTEYVFTYIDASALMLPYITTYQT